ncbi:hypothetical protein CGRA01v4_04733 [Colletotrichum graminicola]|nr:hypothetical protein CGRA01v4_04733 [Colletotrichum graminicola]
MRPNQSFRLPARMSLHRLCGT